MMDGLKTFYAQDRVTVEYILLFPVLFILSIIYFVAVGLIKILYRFGILRSYRPSRRVVSIGNITLGGTGKTPLVEYIASALAKDGHKPAILIRGYKKPGHAAFSSFGDFDVLGDEASMLKENLNNVAVVLSGPDRVTNARYVDKEGECDTIILDDGFQHWRLKRDLDIVAIDATNPFGARFLLPAGHLREPVGALARARVFCLTQADRVSEADLKRLESLLFSIRPDALVLRAFHGPESLYSLKTAKTYPIDSLKGVKVAIFCGIGNPLSFVSTVEKTGAQVSLTRFFDDHEIFSKGSIEGLVREARSLGIEKILTTQKDAQRLKSMLERTAIAADILVLRVALKIIEGKEALDERLRDLYRS